jgi:uncharacterized protein with beta-barrel porin domain
VTATTVFASNVTLSGSGNRLNVGTVNASQVDLTGANNVVVVTGSSSSALANTNAITIGGTNNSVEFTQGLAPSGALVLTVGDAASSGGTLKVGGAGLVLAGSQTLKGKGTVDGSVTLGSGSELTPGNSPGRFTITGSLTIATGASTKFEYTADKQYDVGAGPADLLSIGTLAALGGSVSAYAVGGTNNSSRITKLGTQSVAVLEYGASSVPNGMLPKVTSYVTIVGDSSSTVASGTYSGVVITAALRNIQSGSLTSAGSLALDITRNSFASFSTGNVAATGKILDGALKSNVPAVSNLIDILDTRSSAAAVESVLAALDPGVYAELGNVGVDRLRDIQSGLANHIDMLALDTVSESSLSLGVKPGQSAVSSALEQSRAWTTAYGGWGRRSSDSFVGSPGYSSNNFGDISGVETKLGALTLGLLGAVGSSTANFENGRGKVTSDTWHTGLYGNFNLGQLVLDTSFAYGQSDSTLRRSVNVPGGGSTSGKSLGSEWTGQFGFAVPLRSETGSVILTPSLHVLHSSVKQDGLTESALNGLNAIVDGNSTSSTAVRTGVQAAKITKLADKPTRLTASLDWIHSFDSDRTDVGIALSGAGSTVSRFQGSRTGQDAIRAGIGAEMALTERTRLRLNVDRQQRSGVSSTYGSASFSLFF